MRKQIKGTCGLYEVDSDGEVYSTKRGAKIAKYDSHGYYKVTLWLNNGRYRKAFVHRLVADAFCPRHSDTLEVNHINEDKHDNRAENLEWVTHSQNIRWGRGYYQRGESNRKRVWRIDDNGNRAVYESLKAAGEENCISTSSISSAVNGRLKKAGGYMWRLVK